MDAIPENNSSVLEILVMSLFKNASSREIVVTTLKHKRGMNMFIAETISVRRVCKRFEGIFLIARSLILPSNNESHAPCDSSRARRLLVLFMFYFASLYSSHLINYILPALRSRCPRDINIVKTRIKNKDINFLGGRPVKISVSTAETCFSEQTKGTELKH